MTRNIYFILCFAGIVSFPIYLFPSGGLQISHLFLLLAALLALFQFRITLSFETLLLLWMCIWVWARQFIYGVQTGQVAILPALFFTYNLLILNMIFHLSKKYGIHFFRLVFIATLCAVVLSLILGILGGINLKVSQDVIIERNVAGFNNPNQLAYFAISAAGILSVIWLSIKLQNSIYLLGITVCLFLAIISLSKAALLSIFIFTIVFIFNKRIKKTTLSIIFLALGFVLVSMNLHDVLYSITDYQFYYRIANMANESDGLINRGYLLLLDMDLSLIYGEGEGYAVANSHNGLEFHSTFGNILLSYGALGFLPAMYLFWNLFSKLAKAHTIIGAGIILSPYLLYGLTHNGARFTIAWVFLGVAYACAKYFNTQSLQIQKNPNRVKIERFNRSLSQQVAPYN